MGRAPCCDKANVKRGPWSPEEDAKLKSYIESHGTGGNWIALPQKIGLKRCGKSCRLRWLNYLRPNIKHGGFTEDEDNLICSLYVSIGSRWSIIAAQLPGRTDNDIKNYWNTRLKKKMFGRQRATKKLLDSAKKGAFEETFSVSEGFSIYPDLQQAALPPPPYSGREIPNCGRELNSIIIPPNYPQPDNLGNFSYSCSDQNLLSKNKADGNYYNNFVPSMLNFNDFYTLLNLPGDEFQLAGEIDENIASGIPHCWNNNYAPDNFSGAEILPNNNSSTPMVWPGEVNSPFYPPTELCQRKTPQDWTCLEEPRLLDY